MLVGKSGGITACRCWLVPVDSCMVAYHSTCIKCKFIGNGVGLQLG